MCGGFCTRGSPKVFTVGNEAGTTVIRQGMSSWGWGADTTVGGEAWARERVGPCGGLVDTVNVQMDFLRGCYSINRNHKASKCFYSLCRDLLEDRCINLIFYPQEFNL